MSKIIRTKKTKLMEQYFYDNCDFNKMCQVEIGKNGEGIDLIILKFALPELPKSFSYKKICVYDLIKEINLDTGLGGYDMHFKSGQMKFFDKMIRNTTTINNCAMVKNNEFMYPIDLKYFFGGSVAENPNDYYLETDFKGICMENLSKYPIILTIKLGSIFDVVEGFMECNNNLIRYDGFYAEEDFEKLDQLHLEDLVALVNYVNVYEYQKDAQKEKNIEQIEQIEQIEKSYSYWPCMNPLALFYGRIEQVAPSEAVQTSSKTKISHWMYDSDCIYGEINSFKYKIMTPDSKISKIYICSEFLDKISQFEFQVNGIAYVSKMLLSAYKLIYEHKNNIILDNNSFIFDIELPFKINNLQLNIWFKEKINDFKFEYMYEKRFELLVCNKMYTLKPY